jgi:hypothetical protein
LDRTLFAKGLEKLFRRALLLAMNTPVFDAAISLASKFVCVDVIVPAVCRPLVDDDFIAPECV